MAITTGRAGGSYRRQRGKGVLDRSRNIERKSRRSCEGDVMEERIPEVDLLLPRDRAAIRIAAPEAHDQQGPHNNYPIAGSSSPTLHRMLSRIAEADPDVLGDGFGQAPDTPQLPPGATRRRTAGVRRDSTLGYRGGEAPASIMWRMRISSGGDIERSGRPIVRHRHPGSPGREGAGGSPRPLGYDSASAGDEAPDEGSPGRRSHGEPGGRALGAPAFPEPHRSITRSLSTDATAP